MKLAGFAAVIFDMDGVLVDGEPLHFRAVNELLAEEGLSISLEAYKPYMGTKTGWRDMARDLGLRRPLDEYAAVYREIILAKYRLEAEPLPGAVELVRALERAGVPQPKFGLGVTTVRPLVIKTQTGGYDGRGVQVLHTEEELIQLSGELYWEEFVETQMEVAVVGVATPSGDLFFYPPVEMVFNPDLNICDQVLQPARLNASLTREALEIARTVLKSFLPLGLVGVMAVEMFVSTEGRILVNEVAPRPHNSGHATMEIAQPCQFEAHVRAVMDLPLAPPQIKGAAWMKNLLGIGQGKPVLEGQEILSDPKVRLHLYAKPECRNGRKMGHVSVVAPTPEQALEQSVLVANLRVRGQTLP